MSHTPVVEVVDFAPLRDLARHLEGRVEGAAGNDDPQIPVEHKEGLADRVHDRLRQQERLFGTLKSMQGFVGHHDLAFSHESLRLIRGALQAY